MTRKIAHTSFAPQLRRHADRDVAPHQPEICSPRRPGPNDDALAEPLYLHQQGDAGDRMIAAPVVLMAN
jgi:hypothetical protein